MANFIHRFLNPHCQDCRSEKEDSEVCNSCEILSVEIERLRAENKYLLEHILQKPEEPKPVDISDLKPITSKHIPWNVRRQALEAEDREKARLMKQQSDSIDELEKELGVRE